MKRSELKRAKPIEAKTPLKRTTALNASPLARSTLHQNAAAQRHQPKRRPITSGVPKKVRLALADRSGGLCEIGQQGCTLRAVDPSHRIRTGMGGRKGDAQAAHHVLSNILHACRVCHERCHSQPATAYQHGWMLREGANPVAEPCLYRGELRWLTDDGEVLISEPTSAAKQVTK